MNKVEAQNKIKNTKRTIIALCVILFMSSCVINELAESSNKQKSAVKIAMKSAVKSAVKTFISFC